MARIKARVEREAASLRGKDKIGLKVGAVLGKRKMAKHFELTIADTSFSYSRNEASIRKEAALDGFYVLRANVQAETLDTAAVVSTYKSLAQVERAFRSVKTVDLEVRPIHHRLAGRVRAHASCACSLITSPGTCAKRWRRCSSTIMTAKMRQRTLLARGARQSLRCRQSQGRLPRKTAEGHPVHSFRTLLQDLGTLTRNTVRLGDAPPPAMLASPTPVQQEVFDKLGVPLTV